MGLKLWKHQNASPAKLFFSFLLTSEPYFSETIDDFDVLFSQLCLATCILKGFSCNEDNSIVKTIKL